MFRQQDFVHDLRPTMYDYNLRRALFLLLVWIALSASLFSQEAETPVAGRSGVIKNTSDGQLPKLGAVPAFELQNQDKESVTRKTLQGKILVFNFMYVNCGIECPVTTGNLRRIQEEFEAADESPVLVSVTVDADNDTPERLRSFADRFEADTDTWHFLTGTQTEVEALARGMMLSAGKEGDQPIHSLRFVLVDQSGWIRGFYDGMANEGVTAIQKDIALLMTLPVEEAPPRSIGDAGCGRTGEPKDPERRTRLPEVNASFNALALVLLLAGFFTIKKKRDKELHKKLMLSAFGASTAFLCCYLYYHLNYSSTKFQGGGLLRNVYFVVLCTHVVLAASVPFLAVTTIRYGLKNNREKHRKLAKITFPIWVYVSVTGVLVYLMLYRM